MSETFSFVPFLFTMFNLCISSLLLVSTRRPSPAGDGVDGGEPQQHVHQRVVGPASLRPAEWHHSGVQGGMVLRSRKAQLADAVLWRRAAVNLCLPLCLVSVRSGAWPTKPATTSISQWTQPSVQSWSAGCRRGCSTAWRSRPAPAPGWGSRAKPRSSFWVLVHTCTHTWSQMNWPHNVRGSGSGGGGGVSGLFCRWLQRKWFINLLHVKKWRLRFTT